MENTALSVNNSPDLTAKEQSDLVTKAQSELGAKRTPFIPQIKMKNVKSPLDEFEKGEWYIIREEKNEDGETIRVNESIGMTPEVVVIKRCYSYSAYDEKENRALAWTNEIDGFLEQHEVVLLATRSGKPELAFRGNYREFKSSKEQLENALGKKLKFSNILYVLYKDHLYRLIVSNASVTGVKDGEKFGSYDDCQPGSFEDFKNYIVASETDCYFFTRCTLGHQYLKKNEYYVMTFTSAGEVADRKKSLQAYAAVEDGLEKLFAVRFGQFLSADIVDLETTEEITSEDLPF